MGPAATERERGRAVEERVGVRIDVRQVRADEERRHPERRPAFQPRFAERHADERVAEVVHEECRFSALEALNRSRHSRSILACHRQLSQEKVP